MSKTLIVLNPHAGGGRAGKLWSEIEPILWKKLGELVVAITQRPEDVAQHLGEAYASGLTRVISIGGDGTNHALVNAIARLNEKHPNGEPITYGILPVGTGSDWARNAGIPLKNIEAAADWIASATPRPTDIGLLTLDNHSEYFLNIASAGLGGEVDRRVNQAKTRRPWTFLAATVAAILNYTPQQVQVKLDDKVWYEGRAMLIAVANGTTFGHGMKIAPNAQIDDGVFDVILTKEASKLTLLTTLQKVYDGSHLTHPAVQYAQAKRVVVECQTPISLDLDGEYASVRHLDFQIQPGLLQLLR